MTRDQQLRILKSTKASKEQLREALAASLGVPYEAKAKDQQESIFTKCRRVFSDHYKQKTGLAYSFGAKEGKALKEILSKLTDQTTNATDDEIALTFEALIQNLPDWYKQNAFSLPRINGNFNEIVANIRNNGRRQQSGGNDLKSKLAERFKARQS